MSGTRIALGCSPLREAAYFDPYQRALEAAGATVVRFGAPPDGPASGDEERTAGALLAGVDGVVLPGGWDIEPSLYGRQREPETGRSDPAEERLEIAVARAALAARRPVLGICRGHQLLNVALGGTLHQHVEGHTEPGRPRDELSHGIEIAAGSALAEAAGGVTLEVNSSHHQAVWQVAAGLAVTARGADGVIEGLESPDRLVVAVQFHPEELTAKSRWARDLFAAFVARASG